jgi:hypothetical protein
MLGGGVATATKKHQSETRRMQRDNVGSVLKILSGRSEAVRHAVCGPSKMTASVQSRKGWAKL